MRRYSDTSESCEFIPISTILANFSAKTIIKNLSPRKKIYGADKNIPRKPSPKHKNTIKSPHRLVKSPDLQVLGVAMQLHARKKKSKTILK